MRVLSSADVTRALPMDRAIAAMKDAFMAVSEGTVAMPQRHVLTFDDRGAFSAFMPATARKGEVEALGIKVVSYFPANAAVGISLIQGAVLVLDPSTGQVEALIEGGALTAIRTGAASGAATDLLAREDSRVLAMIGTGGQAPTQIEAVCTARPIETVWLHSLDRDQASALANAIAGRGPVPVDVRLAADAAQAVRHADVVCTATLARAPVFSDADLQPGTHVNAIGAFTPDMCEVPPETVRRALVVVDSREAALIEAGDLIQPLGRGLITREHVATELGEVANGSRPGRTSDDQVTLFKSVGVGAQDVVAAHLAVASAVAAGLGVEVTLQ